MKILNASEQTPAPSSPYPARGFVQVMGIHPAIALFTLCVDAMAFGGEAASFGLFLPVSLVLGCAVGYVTFKGQQSWYCDSEDSAKTKAIMLAVLTALPTALPSLIYAPLGFVGLFRRKH